MPARSACAASSPAGTPISRSATAITASTIRCSNSLNTSFGTASQSDVRRRRAALRPDRRQSRFLARISRSASPTPLSVAVGAEYRNENFQIRPGDLQSYRDRPAVPRLVRDHRAPNCATQGGVYNAGTGICSFPGRAAPAGAQGFPGIPAASATDESRHSYAAYVELDTNLFEGFTAVLAGRFEHFSDFGNTLNGKLALRYEPVAGLSRCAARSRTASARRRSTSNSSPPPRPTSSTACRSTSARSRSTARSRARSARATSSRKSRSTSASARPPIRSAA